MAIYSTFFVCKPEELLDGFPGWRLPLPAPVRREFKNPFTKQVSIIETRQPEWDDEQTAPPFSGAYKAVAIKGSYADYLEGRLPPFVRARPHWCAKGLTEIELNPLGEVCGSDPALEFALYSRPSSGAVLQRLRPEWVSKLRSLDDRAMEVVAKSWTGTMSSPEYTHSVTGVKLSDGWKTSDAMGILRPIVELAKQSENAEGIYLFIEA